MSGRERGPARPRYLRLAALAVGICVIPMVRRAAQPRNAVKPPWSRRPRSDRQVIAEASGHDIQDDQPGLVVEQIDQLLRELRAASP